MIKLQPIREKMIFTILLVLAVVLVNSPAVNGFEVEGLEFPPYIMVKEDGSVQGFIVDLVQELGQRTGKPVEFKISNWARAYKNVTSHGSDALIPTMKTNERLEFLRFPETPLLYLTFHLVSHKDNQYVFSGNFKDLDAFKVGRLRDAKVSPSFDKALEDGKFTIEERNTTQLLVRAALVKRLDFIALDWRVARWEENAVSPLQQLVALEPALGKVPVYIALSKKRSSEKDIIEIDKALSQMHGEGILEQLDEKYFGSDWN